MIKKIISKNNPIIKKILGLMINDKLKKSQFFITLGYKLTIDTIKNFECQYLISYERKLLKQLDDEIKKILTSEKIFLKFMNLNKQPLIGVFEKISHKNIRTADKILILDNIQNPINMGIILRNAGAFNICAIWITPNSTNFYAYKTISVISNPQILKKISILSVDKMIKKLLHEKIKIVTTSLKKGNNFLFSEKYAIVIGNEGHGNSQEFLKNSYENIRIDISSKYNSLNVASATTIILYEYYRKK